MKLKVWTVVRIGNIVRWRAYDGCECVDNMEKLSWKYVKIVSNPMPNRYFIAWNSYYWSSEMFFVSEFYNKFILWEWKK